MQFKDIVGQEKLINELNHVIQSGQLPHAVLLLGKKGWGGLPAGIALAQFLMCEDALEDSCGTCHNCQMMQKMSHPDVAYTFPTIKLPKYNDNLSEYFIEDFRNFVSQSPYAGVNKWLQFINAENSQGNISADQCRRVVEFFNLKAYQGRKKIQVVWLPEFLGKEGNILLKLIEEPPRDSFLIFISEQEHLILGTIRSRLQKFELKPISQEMIMRVLVENYHLQEPRARTVSKLSGGDYEKALELSQEISNDILPYIEEFVQNIYSNNGLAITQWVEHVSKLGREPIKGILQYIQEIYNRVLQVRYGMISMEDLPQEEKNIVKNILSIETDIEIIDKIKKGLQDTQYAIVRNAHIKTQLLNLNIEMQYWIKNRDLNIL